MRLADNWGEPVDWLTQAADYFRHTQFEYVERACRSLLHRAGVAVPRREHGHGHVPAALAATTSVVKDWTEAINRHDTDAALTYLSGGSVFTNTGNGQRFVGVAENRAHYDDLFAVWPDVHFEIVKLFSAGEYYVKEWIMTGVHRGDLPGLPGNDRSFRVLGAGVGVVRDGMIAEVTEYWNFATLLAQVGPVPATVG